MIMDEPFPVAKFVFMTLLICAFVGFLFVQLKSEKKRKWLKKLKWGKKKKRRKRRKSRKNISGHEILTPLQEKIESFERKVDGRYKESIDKHTLLRQQLIGLKELNEQMSLEAVNLTNALNGDNKTQGNSGQLVLERVLEKSGLEKDREYFMQQSYTTSDGKRVLPDVVLHLPDNKKIIIDSKMSLVS